MAVGVGTRGLSLPSIDRSRLLGVALAALAALLVLWLTRPAPTTQVLVVSTDVSPGTPLSDANVSVRDVSDPTGLVLGSSIGELGEWTVAAPLVAGEPLVPSLLVPPQVASAPNVVALSLDPGHAVLGHLSSGDYIDIYRTLPGTFDTSQTTVRIASSVFVIGASFEDDGINRGTVDLLLAVDEELAAVIVAAERSGEVDVVRVSP